MFIELFYIDAAGISEVYSVIYYPEPGKPAPNWEPYQGNWPLPASFGQAGTRLLPSGPWQAKQVDDLP